MNKTWIITKREYLSRVKKRTFILSTFLTPLLFAGVIGIIVFITIHNSDKEKIAVVDNSGVFKNKLDSLKSIKFYLDGSVDTGNFVKKGYSAVLLAPHNGSNAEARWVLYSRKSFGVMATDQVNAKIHKEIENSILLAKYQIHSDKVDSIRLAVDTIKVASKRLSATSKIENGDSTLAYGI
ncbi:MAG: hypothetical protein JST39_07415, partial [Bacteroidetes bacterium]|nr:hypothetical protein [Bacteroidota bacterium]